MRHIALALALAAITPIVACDTNDVAVDPQRLCGTSSASVAARISGTPEPVDMCVSNDETTVDYAAMPDGRYLLRATFVSDGVEFSIQMGFFVQRNQPQTLTLTSDSSLAAANPGSAWFFYEEKTTGADDLVTTSIAGDFRLTLSDQNVAVGTFSNIEVQLESAADGSPAGARMISEGFFAVTPD